MKNMMKRISAILIVVMIALLCCSCSEMEQNVGSGYTPKYTDESYSTIYGTWKTDDGYSLHLEENGTYWRTGPNMSEQGRYTLGQSVLPIGDDQFYRPYDHITLKEDDWGTSVMFYYIHSGNQLKVCRYVDKTDGSFDPDSLYVYKKK